MLTKEICWMCMNTGYILDYKEIDGVLHEGPDNGKPCQCNLKEDADE